MQLTSLFLNLFLCIDLILTLKSPFSVTRNRLKWYVITSLTVSSILVIYIYYMQDRSQILRFPDQHWMMRIDKPKGNLILALSLSAYILVALDSWIFSWRRLNRPGVSKEVRMLF